MLHRTITIALALIFITNQMFINSGCNRKATFIIEDGDSLIFTIFTTGTLTSLMIQGSQDPIAISGQGIGKWETFWEITPIDDSKGIFINERLSIKYAELPQGYVQITPKDKAYPLNDGIYGIVIQIDHKTKINRLFKVDKGKIITQPPTSL